MFNLKDDIFNHVLQGLIFCISLQKLGSIELTWVHLINFILVIVWTAFQLVETETAQTASQLLLRCFTHKQLLYCWILIVTSLSQQNEGKMPRFRVYKPSKNLDFELIWWRNQTISNETKFQARIWTFKKLKRIQPRDF